MKAPGILPGPRVTHRSLQDHKAWEGSSPDGAGGRVLRLKTGVPDPPETHLTALAAAPTAARGPAWGTLASVKHASFPQGLRLPHALPAVTSPPHLQLLRAFFPAERLPQSLS